MEERTWDGICHSFPFPHWTCPFSVSLNLAKRAEMGNAGLASQHLFSLKRG